MKSCWSGKCNVVEIFMDHWLWNPATYNFNGCSGGSNSDTVNKLVYIYFNYRISLLVYYSPLDTLS